MSHRHPLPPASVVTRASPMAPTDKSHLPASNVRAHSSKRVPGTPLPSVRHQAPPTLRRKNMLKTKKSPIHTMTSHTSHLAPLLQTSSNMAVRGQPNTLQAPLGVLPHGALPEAPIGAHRVVHFQDRVWQVSTMLPALCLSWSLATPTNCIRIMLPSRGANQLIRPASIPLQSHRAPCVKMRCKAMELRGSSS